MSDSDGLRAGGAFCFLCSGRHLHLAALDHRIQSMPEPSPQRSGPSGTQYAGIVHSGQYRSRAGRHIRHGFVCNVWKRRKLTSVLLLFAVFTILLVIAVPISIFLGITSVLPSIFGSSLDDGGTEGNSKRSGFHRCRLCARAVG